MTEKLLGPVTLRHRVVMAPLTRMRASPDGNVPTYYGGGAAAYADYPTLDEQAAGEAAQAAPA